MKPWIKRRCEHYNKAFKKWPASHLWYAGNFIRGIWMIGNNYKGSGYYGAYPPTYLKRILSMFPDAKRIFHPFSGSLDYYQLRKDFPDFKHVLMDTREDADKFGAIRGNVSEAHSILSEIDDKPFDLILADPPYSVDDAIRYQSPMVNRAKVMRELNKIVSEFGWVAWMDQVKPMYRKSEWDLIGTIGIDRSTNHRVRMVYLFRRAWL